MRLANNKTKFLLFASLVFTGCSDEGPPPGVSLAKAESDAEPESNPPELRKPEAPPAFVAVRKPATSSALRPKRRAPIPARAPARVSEVLAKGRGSQKATDLAALASQPKAPKPVRATAFRRLQQVDSELALETALKLSQSKDSLLRVNAVGLLARSDDPRAVAALNKLPPRFRRLAATLQNRTNAQ